MEYPDEQQPQEEPPVQGMPLPPGVAMEQMIQWANLVMQAGRAAPSTHQPARAAAASRANSQPRELLAQVRVVHQEIDRSLSYLHDYSRKRPLPYEGQINGLKAEE